jgi:hypothetical protein
MMAQPHLEFALPDASLHLPPWAGDCISKYYSVLDSLLNKIAPVRFHSKSSAL